MLACVHRETRQLIMEVIAIYIVFALLGLGLLGMVTFGIRSITFGKVNLSTMGFVCAPFLLLLILGFAMSSWAEAGIMTIAITLLGALVALFYTGLRGLFS